jgi:hypothetical protein
MLPSHKPLETKLIQSHSSHLGRTGCEIKLGFSAWLLFNDLLGTIRFCLIFIFALGHHGFYEINFLFGKPEQLMQLNVESGKCGLACGVCCMRVDKDLQCTAAG